MSVCRRVYVNTSVVFVSSLFDITFTFIHLADSFVQSNIALTSAILWDCGLNVICPV